MNNKKKPSRIIRTLMLTGLVITTVAVIFSVWLGYRSIQRYKTIKTRFEQTDERPPTLIFSDLTWITSASNKAFVEAELKKRNIPFQVDHFELQTKIPKPNYPIELILDDRHLDDSLISRPELVKQLQSESDCKISFDSVVPHKVSSILCSAKTLDHLPLEPLRIATLSARDMAMYSIRKYTPFADFNPTLWKAVLSVEDPKFLDHHGLDFRGIGRAMFINLKSLRFKQGGSTLSNQLIKILAARQERNLFLKLEELVMSIFLEIDFSKEQIIEKYLNEVYVGQSGTIEVHGVEEAARLFFGKSQNELTLKEATLIAAMIRGPNFYNPYRHLQRALDRSSFILDRMTEHGFLTSDEVATAKNETIQLRPEHIQTNEDPFYVDFVRNELSHLEAFRDQVDLDVSSLGINIYTSEVPSISEILREHSRNHLDAIDPGYAKRFETAGIIIENNTASILAVNGSRSFKASSYNRALLMKRPIGSTFKPIIYLTALAKKVDPNGIPYGPLYPVVDEPIHIVYDQGRQKWSPKNYEKEFTGPTNMRNALAHSINTIAAKLSQDLTLPAVSATAKDLDLFPKDLDDSALVPSLALGTTEVNPLKLAETYLTFANLGLKQKSSTIRFVDWPDGSTLYRRGLTSPSSRSSVSIESFRLLTDMLQTVTKDGTAAQLTKVFKIPFDVAGKTGTTSDHQDAWFAGYSSNYTVLIWVGPDENDSGNKPGSRRNGLTGATAAVPIWAKVMLDLEQDSNAKFPSTGESLRMTRIEKKSGRIAPSDCPDDKAANDLYPDMTGWSSLSANGDCK